LEKINTAVFSGNRQDEFRLFRCRLKRTATSWHPFFSPTAAWTAPRPFDPGAAGQACELEIRPSDEDPGQIWQMITDEPLRLSLAYVAAVSPRIKAYE
jgi:hypothetical protein